MTAIKCPVPGTYLVIDENLPIPFGKTETDVSIQVFFYYRMGWVCTACGFCKCEHVEAAKKYEEKFLRRPE